MLRLPIVEIDPPGVNLDRPVLDPNTWSDTTWQIIASVFIAVCIVLLWRSIGSGGKTILFILLGISLLWQLAT